MSDTAGSTPRRRPLRGSAPGNLTYYRDPDLANVNWMETPQPQFGFPQYETTFSDVSVPSEPPTKSAGVLKSAAPELEPGACPYGCCKSESSSEYFFRRGFLEGAYSDVTVKAFGTSYKLHRLFLDKSNYFRSLFKWSERESEFYDEDKELNSDQDDMKKNVYELEFDDPRINQSSFELAIARLYGAVNVKEENKIPYSMIAIGQYLAIGEVVCTATEYIVRNMDMTNVCEIIKFAVSNSYGSASERIIQNGKGILCADGWEVGVDKWDEIPASVIAEVVGEDYFFAPSEWDRCIFIIKLIERRLEVPGLECEATETIKGVLNDKIHYCHMTPEQLQELESYYDVNGKPYIDPQVLHKALWQAVYLQRMVVTSSSPCLANTVTNSTPPSLDSRWFRVPIKDATLAGLPAELDKRMTESLCSSAQGGNIETGKSTQDELPNKQERFYNWTNVPPFRFSIAFANVSDLLTDKRVYGKTFWYAGSYWNLYLQKNRIQSKNTYQIGAYLHRANSGSSNPSSKHGLTNPDVYANNVNYQTLPKKHHQHLNLNENRDISAHTGDGLHDDEKENVQDDSIMSLNELSINEGSAVSSESAPQPFRTPTSGRTSSSEGRSFLTYEDQRNVIRVYFIIFTPSRREKPTITSFLSVPNDFHKSQSWGWKSNSMCVFNEDGTFPQGHDPHLKFMIVLGNV